MPTNSSHAEDFAYFYDTIHGRVSFTELPPDFIPPLRVALNSVYLNRLTRISQLGYTSLTFFSATQTRFSHAIGTLLMMNRIMSHLWGSHADSGIPLEIINAVFAQFPKASSIANSPQISIRCHLLLAALFQDVGELPFQKITSHYFHPAAAEVQSLLSRSQISNAEPNRWKVKDVFTISALVDVVLNDLAFKDFDLTFLVYLITGFSENHDAHVLSLRQMLDGVVDADRLDYVYRDAHLTIGGLTRSDTVIRTIVRYESKGVIVNDPHPITDFLTTRARLWSFVYSSPAVRFRQTLLKSFFQAAFACDDGCELLKDKGLPRELSLQHFLALDDHSMLGAIRDAEHDGSQNRLSKIAEFGRVAHKVLLKSVSDYECRVLEKPPQNVATVTSPVPAGTPVKIIIPPDVFFDLQTDQEEEHKLYVPHSILVDQPLTEKMPGNPVALERCSGALASILKPLVSVPLVPKSFLLFLPEKKLRNQNSYQDIDTAMSAYVTELHSSVDLEDAKRDLVVPDNTWTTAKKPNRKKIAISCSFKDRTHVLRIARELHHLGEPYCLLLDSLLWLGGTSKQNSEKLIRDADAVFIVMSQQYVHSWLADPNGNIAAEVREMLVTKNQRQKVVLPVASYSQLNTLVGAKWADIDSSWSAAPIIVNEHLHGSIGALRKILEAACTYIN
jgi:HD superfamily phosphohydrolase